MPGRDSGLLQCPVEQRQLSIALRCGKAIGEMDERPGACCRVGDRLGQRSGFLVVALGEHEHSVAQEEKLRPLVVELQGRQFFQDAARVCGQQGFQILVLRSVIRCSNYFPARLEEPPGECP